MKIARRTLLNSAAGSRRRCPPPHALPSPTFIRPARSGSSSASPQALRPTSSPAFLPAPPAPSSVSRSSWKTSRAQGSSIAAQYVSRAPKDGYTLFLPALSGLTNEIVNPSSPPLDMSKDFAAVAQLAEGPFFLTVNPALGVHSVADLVAMAKAKPDTLTYGSVGAGSLPHLCGVLFEQRAGIKLVHVPYPGSPETVTDLVANRITMSFIVGSTTLGQINAGQLLPLATTGAKRASLLPNVPTMAEAGVSGFGFNLWLGLLAPPGTPQPVIAHAGQMRRQKAWAATNTVESLRNKVTIRSRPARRICRPHSRRHQALDRGRPRRQV